MINKKKNDKNELIKSLVILFAIIIAVVIILIFFKGKVIYNITVLLLMLSLLIFVHEGGHFLMGKKFGVHIYEFALGMGPKVLSFRRKNDPTEYTLRALPIGGFCQLAGEEGEDDEDLPKDKFMCNKTKLQKAIILIAGVTMNFITALVLLFAIALIWGSTDQSNTIGYITENSPASDAGIIAGDKIVSVNGYKTSTWDKFSIVLNLKNKKDYYEFKIEHKNGKVDTYKLNTAKYVIDGDKEIRLTDDYTIDDYCEDNNVDINNVKTQDVFGFGGSTVRNKGFIVSLKYAFYKFWSIVTTMFTILWALITGKLGLGAMSGPVGMYSIVGTVTKTGIANVIYLTAYLSINLGVMNILPFPAFDGGRVVFIIIEAITRKKVDPKIEGYIHTIGFILIMMLMLFITFHDIINLF